MNKNSDLIKNTFIIFLGKFCTQFISFLLVPIYTNYLSTSDYGYVDLVQTYFALIVPIIILRIDSAVFRFLIDNRDNSEKKIKLITNSVFFVSIQLFICLFLFFITNIYIGYDYFLSILLNLIMISFSSILLQICRGLGDNIGYSISSIISGVVTIILNIVFIIILRFDGEFVLYSSSIANFCCIVFLILRLKIIKKINLNKISKKEYKELLKYSLPMIPDGFSWWIMNVSDRTIISSVIGVYANGIYAVSSKFSNIISSLFQIFNMSWQESASLHINDKDSDEFFSNVFNVSYRVFYCLCLFVLICMPFVFKLFVGNDYIQAYQHVPILLLGNLYNAMGNVIGGVYIANKNTKSVAKTTIFAAVFNIIINVCLINKIGLYAASLSTLLSYIILTIYRFIDSKKYVKWKIDLKTMLLSSVLYLLVCMVYYICTSIFILFICFIIVIIIIIIFNKDYLIKIYVKLLERRKN